MEPISILLIALFLDLAFGEPPNAGHPVAWLGKLICWETRATPQKNKAAQLAYGTVMVLLTVVLIAVLAHFLLAYLKEFSSVAYVIAGAIMLKFTFSLRGLWQTVAHVHRSLVGNKLTQARFSLRSLVSRDTTELSQPQMVSATVESAAENVCDSFVAPLFYFLLFGVPGAIAYRIVNTFDAMLGYHGEYEYSGKFAARLDDTVNFIPARLSALAIVIAAWICRKDPTAAWRIMLRDHKKTESPNAGWTMSAIAGALGVQLEKMGHYKLGDDHHALSLKTMDASLQIVITVAAIWSLLSLLLEVLRLVAT